MAVQVLVTWIQVEKGEKEREKKRVGGNETFIET